MNTNDQYNEVVKMKERFTPALTINRGCKEIDWFIAWSDEVFSGNRTTAFSVLVRDKMQFENSILAQRIEELTRKVFELEKRRIEEEVLARAESKVKKTLGGKTAMRG